MSGQDSNRLRGKYAIEAAHIGIITEDEVRLDAMISKLYGVESEEAAEIHTNFHVEKILLSLGQRARQNGMKKETLASHLQRLDIIVSANQVAKGKLTETAAVDALFRDLSRIETNGKEDDRFNIYS